MGGKTGGAERENSHSRKSATTEHNRRLIERLLAPMVYDELRRYARRLIALDWLGADVDATDAVHEAVARLISGMQLDLGDEDQLTAILKRGVRRCLVDWARQRDAVKRGKGHRHVTINEALIANPRRECDSVDLEQAIERLSRRHERAYLVLTSHVFGEQGFELIAICLGVSRKTVVQDWNVARRFIARELRIPPRAKINEHVNNSWMIVCGTNAESSPSVRDQKLGA